MPRAVLAATLAFALLLALWSTALPLGDAPDETAHADLVFHLATGAPYPRFDERRIGVAMQQLCLDTTAAIRACPRRNERVTATGIRRHTDANAPSKARDRTSTRTEATKKSEPCNQMLQHPPLYYELMSGVVRAERFVTPGRDLPPLDREFALLRLANVLLIAPLPLLAWWACRRLGLADEIGIVASLVPFAVPQLLHIGSTLNNDNLLTFLVAVLTVLLAGVVRGDMSRRTAVAVGVVTGLALLTKAFALLLPVVIVAAYALAWWRNRGRRAPVVGLAIAGIVTAALGGWWYLRNVIRGDGISPSTENDRLTDQLRPRGFHPDPATWVRKFGILFTDRFWGWFGWYTVRISIAVIIGATVILLGAMALGLGASAPRLCAPTARPGADGRPIGRLDLGVLLLPAMLFGAFVAARSWSLYEETSLFSFIQGRYLFGAIVGIAVVAAVGLHRAAGRWAAAVTFAWVVVMQVEGLRRVLSGYWRARERTGRSGAGARCVERLAGEAFAVAAVAFLAATLWLVIEVMRTTRPAMVIPPKSPKPPDRRWP